MENNQKRFAQVILIAVILVLLGLTEYFVLNKKIPEDLTFTDNAHISFQYPPDWKVGTFKVEPNSYSLSPADKFTPESKSSTIFITVSGHCMNTQCLTVYTLDDIVKQLGVKILSTANAKNVTGYEVSFTAQNGKSQNAYMFIKGKDLVTITTDIYSAQMDAMIPSLELLAADAQTSGDTSAWKTYMDPSSSFYFQYPEKLATDYIHVVNTAGVATWPPSVKITTGNFSCKPSVGIETDGSTIIQKTIDGKVYCVTDIPDGAAGTIYHKFSYQTAAYNSQLITLSFTLGYVECGNYSEPQMTQCNQERASFDVGSLVGKIFSTFRLRK